MLGHPILKEFVSMNQYFPQTMLSSGRCCGPVMGSTGDVRLSFGGVGKGYSGFGDSIATESRVGDSRKRTSMINPNHKLNANHKTNATYLARNDIPIT